MVFGILFHHLVVLLNNNNRRFLPLFTKGLPFIVGWVLLFNRTNEEDVIVINKIKNSS